MKKVRSLNVLLLSCAFLFLVTIGCSLPSKNSRAVASTPSLMQIGATNDGICELVSSKTFQSGLRFELDNANAKSRHVSYANCKTECEKFAIKHPAKCDQEAERLVRSDLTCIYSLVNDVPPDTIPPVLVIKQDTKNCAVWSEPASNETEVLLFELLSGGERRVVRGSQAALDGVTECKRVWNKRTRCASLDPSKKINRIFSCYGFSKTPEGERRFRDYLSESGLCNKPNQLPCGHGIYTDGIQFYDVQIRVESCNETE